MFSAKVYTSTATVLRTTKPKPTPLPTEYSQHADSHAMHLWLLTVGRFADAYALDNPRFNRHQFLVACEAIL